MDIKLGRTWSCCQICIWCPSIIWDLLYLYVCETVKYEHVSFQLATARLARLIILSYFHPKPFAYRAGAFSLVFFLWPCKGGICYCTQLSEVGATNLGYSRDI